METFCIPKSLTSFSLFAFLESVSVLVEREELALALDDMELPFDVLEFDYIFDLLISDPETPVKCTKALPLFPQILSKHLFYHIVIHLTSLSTIGHGFDLSVSHLIESRDFSTR